MNKIIYLDAAATCQKPESVISAEMDFLRNNYANAGRGVCARAVATDDMILNARRRVAEFMNADENQIVFTHGTTIAINMIARMLHVTADMVVAVSDLDHHSARLPFVRYGGKIVLCPLDANLDIDADKIRYADVLVLTAMSNVLGRAQNVSEIVRRARLQNPGVIVVVDAAQYVVHDKIDVCAWDADFVVWSAHKIGADTGLGIMYIKNPNDFCPPDFGGGMVNKIVGDDILLADGVARFEAGTQPLTQIAGLVPAIDALEKNRPNLDLIKYMYDELQKMPQVKILSSRDSALLTFVVSGMHVLDFGVLAGARGLCLRVGNMCATWIHEQLNVPGSIRLSVGGYNTIDDVKQAIGIIKDILK